MAATQQGGRHPGAGRLRFVVAASRPARAVLRFDKELHSSWNSLKQRGGFHSDAQFVAHLISLEESRQSQLVPSYFCTVILNVIPDRGTVWSGIRFYNYVMWQHTDRQRNFHWVHVRCTCGHMRTPYTPWNGRTNGGQFSSRSPEGKIFPSRLFCDINVISNKVVSFSPHWFSIPLHRRRIRLVYIVYTVKLTRVRPCETSHRITRLQNY